MTTHSHERTLDHRVAVVTGASAGIGEAIARHLADAGASVVLNARREKKLNDIASSINDRLERTAATVVAGDTADPATIESMLQAARLTFGKPASIVVANAGRGLNGSVLTSNTDEWDEMIRTNLVGVARLLRAAAEDMLAHAPDDWQTTPRDLIVIGSVVGRNVSPFSSMYGSTKFAVRGLAEGLRRELASNGIRVSLVEPAFVVSEFQGVAGYDPEWVQGVWDKIGPVLKPDDIARAVTFLTSQPAAVHISDIMVRPTRQEYP